MYNRGRPFREELYKTRKTYENMPSFSSTLLDEIYRSIDGNAESSEGFKAYKEKTSRRLGVSRGKTREDEGIASFRRACLVEKWMEKEANEKVVAQRRHQPLLPDSENKSLQDNDLMFFSSTSSSSDSSGALSSSDTEFFSSTTTKPKVSCFSTRPRPVRTGVGKKQEDCLLFDEKNKAEVDQAKSKSRALKIYANLKKVKQPISPGGRLTSFINSLFSNTNGKKSKNVETSKGFQDLKSPKAPTTCSSASSFSRSCLSKYSPKSREKMRNGAQRTVRFDPVSVIVDGDSRPCGHKCIYDEDSDVFGRLPLPPTALAEVKMSKMEKNTNVEEAAQSGVQGCNSKSIDDFSVFKKIHNGEDEDEEDDDDLLSDSSSDLFELDNLALFGDNRFCEELPVYETTHFDTNRAIACRLIR